MVVSSVQRLSLVVRHPSSTFSNGFFYETSGPISVKFLMYPSSKGGKSLCIWSKSLDQDAPPPAPLYMVKTWRNLLLLNHLAKCLETWFVLSRDLVLQSLYKWWPWEDLDLFYGKVQFGLLGFWMEKVLKKCIFIPYAAFKQRRKESLCQVTPPR